MDPADSVALPAGVVDVGPEDVVPSRGGRTEGLQPCSLDLDMKPVAAWWLALGLLWWPGNDVMPWLTGPLFGRALAPVRIDWIEVFWNVVLWWGAAFALPWFTIARRMWGGRLEMDGEGMTVTYGRGKGAVRDRVLWVQVTQFRLGSGRWWSRVIAVQARTTYHAPRAGQEAWPAYVRGLSRREVIDLMNRYWAARQESAGDDEWIGHASGTPRQAADELTALNQEMGLL